MPEKNESTPPPPPERHEGLRPDLVDAVLDAGSTSQMRLLMLTITAYDPDRPWTYVGMRKELNKRQGEDPGWHLEKSANGMIVRYSRVFADAGLAQLTAGTTPSIIQSNETTADVTLATTVSLLEWQRDTPQIPLQSVFGSTYRKGPEGQRGHSSLRLAITGQAMKGGSQLAIAEVLGESPERVNDAVRDLTDAGVLAVRAKTDRSVRMLQIDPAMTQASFSPRPGTLHAALWNTAKNLANQGTLRISGNDFLAQVEDIVDKNEAWTQLVKSLGQDRLPYLSFEPLGKDPRSYTEVSVNPEYRQPLARLLQHLEAIRSGQIPADLRKRARHLLNDQASVAQLMTMAHMHAGGTSPASEQQASETTGTTASPSIEGIAAEVQTTVEMLSSTALQQVAEDLEQTITSLAATLEGSTDVTAFDLLETLHQSQARLRNAIGQLAIATTHLQEYRATIQLAQ